MNILKTACASILLLQICTGPAMAHFGMVIPDNPIITQHSKQTVLKLSFSHPFENIGMELKKPEKFTVTANGKTEDVKKNLLPTAVMDHSGWQTEFTFHRPGVYQFAMEPTPYWEPSEDLFIIHYTKTVIPAFGDDVGWDEPLGLATEIVALTRPFGNYSGNSFTGQVLLNGKPVAGAEIEVEHYNQTKNVQAPSDYHITQVTKADANGIFTFTCPLPGWWGFAALNEADYTLKNPDGQEKGVELGAVFWTYFHPLPGLEK